jgi:hypothetical protein
LLLLRKIIVWFIGLTIGIISNSCRGVQKQCIDSKEAGATEIYAPITSSRVKIVLDEGCRYSNSDSRFYVVNNNILFVGIIVTAQSVDDSDCFSHVYLRTSVAQKELENFYKGVY